MMSAVGAGQLEQARVRTGAVAAPPKKTFPWQTAIVHAPLIACIAVVVFPLYHALPGPARPADGLGDRDLPPPPVLHDDPERAGRSRAARRRRPRSLPLPVPAAAVLGEHRRSLRRALHLRLEPVPLAAPDHQHG